MDYKRKCNCSRKRGKINEERKERRRERCTRLRQTLVCNQDEQIHHEPYMDTLRDEYYTNDTSCISGVELPWEEFAIGPDNIIKINDPEEEPKEEEEEPAVRKESSGLMCLPWNDLVVKRTLQSEAARLNITKCDSALEIPWEDILFDPEIEYEFPEEDTKKCIEEEVEIPWNELLIPKDLVLIPKRKKFNYYETPVKTNKKCGCSMRKILTK